MVTIISGTNRKGSISSPVARQIKNLVAEQYVKEVELLDLAELQFTLLPHQYSEDKQSPDLSLAQDQYIVPSNKLIFVVPEYNGSYPGILKLFLDAISVRDYKKTFANKDALLIGVSTGRAGNLRGLDQLDQVLQHLGVNTYPRKFPISLITQYMEKDMITDKKLLMDLKVILHSYADF